MLVGQDVACISSSPERAPQNLHHESLSAGMCPAHVLSGLSGGQGPTSIKVPWNHGKIMESWENHGIMGKSWNHTEPWNHGFMKLEQNSETHIMEPLTSCVED